MADHLMQYANLGNQAQLRETALWMVQNAAIQGQAGIDALKASKQPLLKVLGNRLQAKMDAVKNLSNAYHLAAMVLPIGEDLLQALVETGQQILPNQDS